VFRDAQSKRRIGDARIDDPQWDRVLPRKHTDGGAACQHVVDHLCRNRLWIGRNALRCQTMIGRKNHHARCVEANNGVLLNQPELQGERLDSPKCAEGFGLAVDHLPQSLFECRIGNWCNRRNQ